MSAASAHGRLEATIVTRAANVVDDVLLRPATPADAAAAGQICYEAFHAIASRHGYPGDFPSPAAAAGTISSLIEHPRFYGVVAELDGVIVGSNFLDERSSVGGVGPITIHPGVQNLGVGRALMADVLDRAANRRFASVRLVQAAYHTRSLALYAKLGFQVRELLACLQGEPIHMKLPGRAVRQAVAADLEAANQLCRRVHGQDRGGELEDALAAGTATVTEHNGRITGYATATAFFGHAVGETVDDLKAILGAASAYGGPGILVPARSELLHWCLERGLRVVQLMSLMSRGWYGEPRGAYLPSILY